MNPTIYGEDAFQQGSDLWLLARLGLPTASCFKTVMAKGRADAESKARSRYMDDLVAELITGVPVERYRNRYMERGKAWEPDAMGAYISTTGAEVKQVAFIRNDDLRCGGSPDGLVGDDGGVEIKTLEPGLMVALLCAPGVPQQHMPQVQGLMMVTGRQWWDVVIFSPGFRPYIERVRRDEAYIGEIKRYLSQFQGELERRVLTATQEETTYKGIRSLRDQQFLERLEEEISLPLARVAEDLTAGNLATPSPQTITEALEKSLEREQWLEDGE